LNHAATLSFWTLSNTLPRSPSRTGAPFLYATTIERYWSALLSWPVAFTVNAFS